MSMIGVLTDEARRRLEATLRRHRDNRDRRMTLRNLETLDGATLRDMGMSRAELTSICFSVGNDRRRSHA
ncbi:MAG: hypothetical protein AAF317_02985 [Pseudomonadota bacterium]